MNNMNKRNLIIAGIIITLALVAGGFYLWSQKKAEVTQNNVEKQVVENNKQEQKGNEEDKENGVVGKGDDRKNEGNQEQNNQDDNSEELDFEKIDTSNWKTYRNEEFGFEVKYPEGWEVAFNKNKLIISPVNDKKTNYNILIISIEKNGSINKFVNDYGKLSPEFNGKKLSRIINKDVYNGNNFNGEKMIGTTDIGINKKIIITLKKDNMFIFSYNDINLQKKEIENIISTFKFINQN